MPKRTHVTGGGPSSSIDHFIKKPATDTSIGLHQLASCESLFGRKMSRDLVALWQLCTELNPTNPRDALIPTLGLRLVGPFDTLAQKHVSQPNLHYRFFHDPPELCTIIVNEDSTIHYGYFSDDPARPPRFIARSSSPKSCSLNYAADNLLELIYLLSNKCENSRNLQQKLLYQASINKIDLNCAQSGFKARKRLANGSAFHKLGVVVPIVDEVGYRPPHHEDAELRKMMDKVEKCGEDAVKRVEAFAPLQEQITFIQFANDESDFGMGLEFGLDFFLHGAAVFHKAAGKLLPTAYRFLKRDLYGDIVSEHLENRHREFGRIVYCD